MYNGKCKTQSTKAKEMGCVTFNKDTNECICEEGKNFDIFGCVEIPYGCERYLFSSEKCIECIENQYQWNGECYDCEMKDKEDNHEK